MSSCIIQAQALLGRLEGGRRLYVYVDEFMVHKNLRPTFQRPAPQDLVNLQESNGTVSQTLQVDQLGSSRVVG
jgi:hypothetical protein